MLILALDTSTETGSLAVLRDAKVIGVVSTSTAETYSSRMFRQLEFLLHELALETRQFDLYAVAAGPGSFTGVRVGLTAVKGWAEVYQKPVAAMSVLEAVAAQSRSSATLLAPVMDARRGQIYGGLYARAGGAFERRGEDVVMTLDEYFEELGRRDPRGEARVVTSTPEEFARHAEHLQAESARKRMDAASPAETVSPVLAPAIGQLGWARARRGEVVDALTLDAHYVRRSDAELLWKGE